ncbi:phosphoserine aminotransferase [Trichonephila inaurata madagascariensis]|uniref:Phosphoserine aminotransferase n=1 Tax=Trichonephila inaurata madagascariensis TaxID=2747483 RepID=A0A8X6WM90_9ARAC|nr:phosphoserine aminotransferase [Trichonephila inaurata madagascariensis]
MGPLDRSDISTNMIPAVFLEGTTNDASATEFTVPAIVNQADCLLAPKITHRSVDFGKINSEAEAAVRDIYQIPPNYKVLFLQGGGTGQFAGVPLNLISSPDDVADYIVTGVWSSKAAQEAEKYCRVNRVLPKTSVYTGIPDKSEWKLSNNAKYVYYCSNETINGIEFDFIPETNGVPLVCDMSSNVLTRPIDISKFGVIFAGAQKNAGIPGITLVIVREDLIGKGLSVCPAVFDYKINAANQSLYNTPPTFSVYILGLVFKWVLSKGGISAMDQHSAVKSSLVYDVLDASNGFYHSIVKKENRSRMNIPFRVGGPGGNDELEAKFLSEAKSRKMISLKGHRSVGGIRISLYNAITLDETKALVDFLKEFQANNQ